MGFCFQTTCQVIIYIANHKNNLTSDFLLIQDAKKKVGYPCETFKKIKIWNDGDIQRAIVAVQKWECGTKLAAQR